MAHPLSCVPSLHGHYSLLRYYRRSDSGSGGSSAPLSMNSVFVPLPVSLIISMSFPSIPSPTIVVSSGNAPAADGFFPPLRLRQSSEDSPCHADRIEFTFVTDWPFSPRCSPPRIAATQLRLDTSQLFTARMRTFTAPTHRLLRRTDGIPLGFSVSDQTIGRLTRIVGRQLV
jgi:hypothetical protein